ncbi:MAG: transglycosylase SLT domain-containing protein [Deltaproteobacteria bacterium]|nr:transglycosylase SLT domain-containing protein [Deltaproteobacteria bacterium]MBI4795247.1 transglycosylase SLT domain-containing protein [Deltaproteobacteria bacterium]
MFSWGMGVVLCLLLLTGCGGGHQGLVKNEVAPPEVTVPAVDTTPDEPLTEELSAKRLEELYAKSGIPGWDPGLEEELKKWDHQVKFDVPIHTNRQVKAYLVYFSTERKEVIRRYLSRSTRYLPMIKAVFQEYGLPEDLAYLAMIESGFNANAYSHAHACGMWQFIKGTGARYGLSMDSYVDERRDPEKSTRAAAKYLLDLYKQFGSWYLAAASYNCGEGRVQRELNQSSHKNFWELSDNQCLPTETKNYVPQMIAATIIAKNPEKFGFKKIPYLPPLAVEKVQVNETTSLRAAAVAVNVPVEEVQALNPALLRGVTPPDEPSYALNLPSKSKEVFAKNITLARIEHPAVASRPTRVAKSAAASRRSTAAKASEHVQVSANSKATKKSKAVAKKAGKKGKIQVASTRKGKHDHHRGEKAATHTASMLPISSPSKSAQKERVKVASKDTHSKGKEKGNSKKSSLKVAKKTENGSKTSKSGGKGNSSAHRSKDTAKGKVSKSSSRALIVSEAR